MYLEKLYNVEEIDIKYVYIYMKQKRNIYRTITILKFYVADKCKYFNIRI